MFVQQITALILVSYTSFICHWRSVCFNFFLCFIGVMSGTQSDSALAGACNITLDSPRSLRQPNLVISFPYFSSSATWAFRQLINWKYCSGKMQRRYTVFIGPESDHWLCLSVTNSLTDSLPFSKLDWCDPGVWRCQLKTVEVVTVADVDALKRVDDSLVQI